MAQAPQIQNDDPRVRVIVYDADPVTKAQSVLDIVEYNQPAKTECRSWTTLTRDADATKRALLLDLSRQIDQLVAGKIDEIRIVVSA